MSTTYKTVSGDTFEIIARKRYGSEVEAPRIVAANPGLAEPLTPGLSIIVPDISPAIEQPAAASNPDEVAILILGKRFRFWEQVRISRSIDSIDTVDFNAPFAADAPDFRETFRPFSYPSVEVTVGGDPLFSGVMVSVAPNLSSNRKTLSVSAYSRPGVLGDCNAPASAFPIEFNGQNLREIAKTLADPFGISVEFLASPGAAFEQVALSPGQKILEFLIDLAQQRNLIAASTTRGALIFLRPTDSPTVIANLRQGESPLVSVTPAFNPQNYYSHITGIEPTGAGVDGSQFTVKNERLAGVLRPFTFTVPDVEGGDLKVATEAKAARMFASVAAYSVQVATWRDPLGNLWEPGTTVKLTAPDAMIYNEYSFLVRSVELAAEGTSRTATLNLVIPGTFSGKLPGSMPWDE